MALLLLLPGLFWAWFICRQDRYDREPARVVLRVALMGAAAAVPASLAEAWLTGHVLALPGSPLFLSGVGFLLVVGPVEEFFKFFVVRRLACHDPAFNEPADGIVYAVAAAVGFATMENLGYVLAHGPNVLFLRGPWCTLGHVVFSAVWGSALGLERFHPNRRFGRGAVRRGRLLGSRAPAAHHNLLTPARPGTLLGFVLAGSTVPLVFLLFALIHRQLRRAVEASPLR